MVGLTFFVFLFFFDELVEEVVVLAVLREERLLDVGERRSAFFLASLRALRSSDLERMFVKVLERRRVTEDMRLIEVAWDW